MEDITEGLTAVVSVSVPEPQFVGQTKEELGTAGVTKAVQDVVTNGLKLWIDASKTKNQARLVLEKIANAALNRVASRSQREAARRKTALEGASMPAKLVDCRAIGVNRSELFLVEGDSALGSARQGRNSEYQALLPLRGKILNVQKASMADMLKNAECAAIIQCVGAGSGKTFDLEQMRYGRIMIMADADVDGSHIRSLLIVLFAKYMREVIEDGRLYAAMPPLHKIEVMGKGGETLYTYTQEEMESTVAGLEKQGKKIKTPVARFKGLGEMDAEELWETTMDPSTRSVRKITIEDISEAETILELLFGDEVAPRRDWIIANSHRVDKEAIDV
jgi:DNA gyrase subunit B